MNKYFKHLSMAAVAALAFAACSDVPELPYPFPGDDNDSTTVGGVKTLPYSESFSSSLGEWTNQTTSGEGAWINDYKTAKATGYDNASKVTTAGTYYLISPEISLEGVEEAYIAYEYILRYNKGDENQKVLIAESAEEPEWSVLNTKHTEGRDWSTFETAELNIPAEYVGKTIRIAFYYNTNAESGSTWEVRNFSIQEGKVAESGDEPTPDDPNAVKTLPYSESFSSSLGSFVNETTSGSGEWINDYQTAKATGYDNASTTTTAGTYYLISPQISLEGVTEAHVAYEYILRYNKGDENQKVLISADYTDDATMASWAVLKADHTEGTDWVTFESADINIPAEYMGKTIRIAFYYNTNNESGSTWEVRNFAIAEGKASEGGNDDNEEPVEPEGDNLIGNGGFEAWSGSTPTNWKSTTTAGNASLAQSTDAHSGSYSVKVSGTSSANKRLGHKEITLKAGSYHVQFYTKAASTNGSSARPGYTPVGDDGKVGQYVYGDYANDLTTTEWTEVNFDFTLASQTTINLVVMCAKNPGTDILVDDYTLTTTDGGLVDSEGGEDEGGEEEENPGDVTYSGKYVKVTEFAGAGTYLLVNGDQAFTQLDATKTYGYMPAATVSISNGEIAASAATEAAKLTIAATDGGYTLQDASARYIYMKGTYNSFNIGTTATESYVWTITANGDDTFSVTNADMGKTIMYDTQYSNFGCYPDKTDARLYVNIYKYIAE
ncbi:MAG: choice-of-anchor J domain-containing protein [Bacteroidaceae bacterium]|nr:choice-of-anchor J domain-containing protein [Bacteroidaceae bacterium]